VADIASRRDALRQAADMPGTDLRTLTEAALTELDAAIEAIGAPPSGAGAADGPGEALPEAVRTERRLLHAVFQQAPVPLFLLEQDGTIRRANNKAADLLGAPSGYATGKSLSVFVDLPFRAAIQTLLAAVGRTGQPRSAGCRMLTAGGPVNVALTATAADLPGDPQVLIVTAVPAPQAAGGGTAGAAGTAGTGTTAPATAGPQAKPAKPAKRPAAKASAAGAAPGQDATAGQDGAARQGTAARQDRPAGQDAAADAAIAAMTRRLDTVTAVTRVLLDNSTFSEAVTLQRCARLLAGDIADWVLIDIERGGGLLRQFAAGPRAGQADQLSRVARAADPEPESVPAQVHATGKSVLLAHPDDPAALGRTPEGVPLLMMLGATSVISVPISDGTTGYGALTLTRLADKGPFGVADLGLAEELGRHLAIAIRVDRVFRQRSQVAEALQASLLPARLPGHGLPAVPGLEFTAAYIGATQFQEISGDFYDVFKTGDGWAIAVGDVCGKGQDAAAMTAAARHAIRALASVHKTPDKVLAAANQVLVAEDYDDRFVTASLAFLRQRGRHVQVSIGGCGHPGPAVVRADGRVEILEQDGLPLGLFDDIQPGRTDLELHPGDVLFFYTDGVTEARNADLSFFEDHLADALAGVAGRPAAEVVRAVQELVTSFSSGELKDDVTILAVKVGLRLVDVLDDLGVTLDRTAGHVVFNVVLVKQGRPGRLPGLQRLRARAGDILLNPAARVGAPDHPAAKPAVGGLGQQDPDQADNHQHPAGRVQVEERGIGRYREGEDRADADERKSCSGFHRKSFPGGLGPPSKVDYVEGRKRNITRCAREFPLAGRQAGGCAGGRGPGSAAGKRASGKCRAGRRSPPGSGSRRNAWSGCAARAREARPSALTRPPCRSTARARGLRHRARRRAGPGRRGRTAARPASTR
jgi:serine phosphatase RsbU (regulator of sigma subunit)/PAS domain-containing protein